MGSHSIFELGRTESKRYTAWQKTFPVILGIAAKVKELMIKVLCTITPKDMVGKVFMLCHFRDIWYLSVLERGKLTKIVSDCDRHFESFCETSE